MIKNVLVVGAGSAGLIAAIGLRRKLPHLEVRMVHCSDPDFVPFAESATPNVSLHLFSFLGIRMRHLYEAVRPTWRLGIQFQWGPRPHFNYAFSKQFDSQLPGLPRPNGYYCDDDITSVDPVSALMDAKKVFNCQQDGSPLVNVLAGFHLENEKFVAALKVVARECGVEMVEGNVRMSERGPAGIETVSLEDGRRLHADLFVDASETRSELLGRRLEEPFAGFESSMFSDRAVIGNWQRTDEPILPYTAVETMNCGWSWRIDHETTVNCGYAYSSSAISDQAARDELLEDYPQAMIAERPVKFCAGHYERAWVDNVVAIGGANGYVEPLQSGALTMACWQCEALINSLQHCMCSPTPSMRKMFNRASASCWDDIRTFIALHYKADTEVSSDFWRRANRDADVSGIADLLEFYEENGPTGLCRQFLQQRSGSFFGVEGFLALMVGTKWPYLARNQATTQELEIWNNLRAQAQTQAQQGIDIQETLAYIHHPAWRWADEAGVQ